MKWLRWPGRNGQAKRNRLYAPSALAAVSGDACDEECVRLACELLESPQSRLHILYVIEVSRSSPLDATLERALRQGENVLRRMETVAAEYKCVVQAEIVQARRAGSAVVAEAVQRQVDTIVIGLPYSVTYGIYSLGDHIPYVLQYAPCKVVVFRDPMNRSQTLYGAGRRSA